MKNLKLKVAILTGVIASIAFGTYKLIKRVSFGKKEKATRFNNAEVYDSNNYN